jgi:threonine 3-dehydrogenase
MTGFLFAAGKQEMSAVGCSWRYDRWYEVYRIHYLYPLLEELISMTRKPVALITGAAGEIGHALIERLSANTERMVITLDITNLEGELSKKLDKEFTGSIMDNNLLERILSEYEVDLILHLAALLSTRSEFAPVTAHQVNVEGTMNLLEFAQRQGESHGRPVVFIYPSSIAAYGLPDLDTKARVGKVAEDQWNTPTTMYGCNKLYCELLGSYYARHYKQLATVSQAGYVDFRSIRFPGLISALTTPSGGTSDYAPEMIHAAARGVAYACFVGAEARIPFMAMPDAVDALLQLAAAPRGQLSRTAYNVGAFSATAEEIRQVVLRFFPDALISYQVDRKREGIVNSWPGDVDDIAARRDWHFSPKYDFERTFSEYLIPAIRARYSSSKQ